MILSIGSGPGGRLYVERERPEFVFRSPCKSLKSRQLLFARLPLCSERPIPPQSLYVYSISSTFYWLNNADRAETSGKS
jgi:hypothetical protein